MVRRRSVRSAPGGRSNNKGRLIAGAIMAIIAIISYFGSQVYNPVTDEKQHLSLTQEQEIALGGQAEPQLIQEFGGLHPDEQLQAYLDEVGWRIVRNSQAAETDWDFEFHLLDDAQTINAFALPGGPVFITTALFERLQTEGQLAGVLAHEIGHVVARHSAQRLAKSELTQGLTGAVAVASGDARAAQVAAVVGQLINMRYGREDELQSDELGVRFMADAGYDPRGMIEVMRVLAEAGGGAGQPEFFSTHPNPDNRIENIEAAIRAVFPDGVPEGLQE
jgi:beta-barrel assembly-enhancing protease